VFDVRSLNGYRTAWSGHRWALRDATERRECGCLAAL